MSDKTSKYYYSVRDKALEYQKNYYKENRNEILLYQKNYYNKNKMKIRENQRNNRLKKNGLINIIKKPLIIDKDIFIVRFD